MKETEMKDVYLAVADGYESTHILMVSESINKIKESIKDFRDWINKRDNKIEYNVVYISKHKPNKLISDSIYCFGDSVVEVLLKKNSKGEFP